MNQIQSLHAQFNDVIQDAPDQKLGFWELEGHLFSEDLWQEDRPLFVQFCANNPDTLLEASQLVEDQCDYVDINFGYPSTLLSISFVDFFLSIFVFSC